MMDITLVYLYKKTLYRNRKHSLKAQHMLNLIYYCTKFLKCLFLNLFDGNFTIIGLFKITIFFIFYRLKLAHFVAVNNLVSSMFRIFLFDLAVSVIVHCPTHSILDTF